MSQARSDKKAGRHSRAQEHEANPAPQISSTERSGATGAANRASVPAAETRFNPTQDEIAARAYRCWHERGCPDGSPELDWSRAEQELRSEYQTTQEHEGNRRAQAAFPAI